MKKFTPSRRDALKFMASAVGGLSALALLNCGEGVDGVTDGGTATGGGTAATGGGTGSGLAWATAGTSVMSGKDYGNPFASGLGSTCNVYKSSTEGPCHSTSGNLERVDLSEGFEGLPTRLEFLIVDAACNPVPNATVELWHCDTFGVYSSDIDGSNDAMCTGGDAQAAAAKWGRGHQTSGSDGRVTFDTNFPGWYASRATHIHFRVTVNGSDYLVSQLFFDEALKTEIYNSQPNYAVTSGPGYQVNASDKVVSESALTLSEVVFSTAQQSDGALLAWKAITINS
jgi:protocatechuate 3,4-dioxygenase beta subunit